MKLRFRTGEREVPDHLAALMQGIETRTMTYEEAMDAANKKQLSDYLNEQQKRAVADHFARLQGRIR